MEPLATRLGALTGTDATRPIADRIAALGTATGPVPEMPPVKPQLEEVRPAPAAAPIPTKESVFQQIKDVFSDPTDHRNLIDKLLGQVTYDRESFLKNNPQFTEPGSGKTTPQQIISALGNNETGVIPADKQYTFSQPSGSKTLGRALGKYQVTEGELKTYAKQFLGTPVTAKQFLSSPAIQDLYTINKVKFLQDQGLTDEQILASHRFGMPSEDPAMRDTDIAKKVQRAQKYIQKGLAFIQQQSTGGQK